MDNDYVRLDRAEGTTQGDNAAEEAITLELLRWGEVGLPVSCGSGRTSQQEPWAWLASYSCHQVQPAGKEQGKQGGKPQLLSLHASPLPGTRAEA